MCLSWDFYLYDGSSLYVINVFAYTERGSSEALKTASVWIRSFFRGLFFSCFCCSRGFNFFFFILFSALEQRSPTPSLGP